MKGHHGGVSSSQTTDLSFRSENYCRTWYKLYVRTRKPGNLSYGRQKGMIFCMFHLVCTSYYIGSLLQRNPNSLFEKVKKGNPGGIPRNPWGMHNLAKIVLIYKDMSLKLVFIIINLQIRPFFFLLTMHRSELLVDFFLLF